jgi:hypothetical protein
LRLIVSLHHRILFRHILVRGFLNSGIVFTSPLLKFARLHLLRLGTMATAAKTAESTKEMPPAPVAQQSGDNVAHALAGAGGGILSTALTFVSALQPFAHSLAHSLTATRS